MAITLHLSISPHPHHHLSTTNHHHHHPFLKFPKTPHHHHYNKTPISLSSSPSSSSFQTNTFLTNKDLSNLQNLSNFTYHKTLQSGGFLYIRLMKEEEMDMTVSLLSESFAESMMMAKGGYIKLLEFLVKNYLIERREKMPHNATLLAVYREEGEEDFELAGTVELTFNRMGANAKPPTPLPPKNAPYICNMAVRKELRRRGIGWHLLKAGDELITQMSSSREVYLHCRIIDEGPFNMYTRAGYTVAKTDSILTLFALQRRRHLMRKDLPAPESASAVEFPNEQQQLS